MNLAILVPCLLLAAVPVTTFVPGPATAGNLRLRSRPPAHASPAVGRFAFQSLRTRTSSGDVSKLQCSYSSDVPVYGAESTDTWQWRGHSIRYGSAGAGSSSAPCIVMVHGFGSSADTWRKQYKEYAAAGYRVFGIDLLGFGLSDKPLDVEYSIDLWSEMVLDFIEFVAGKGGSAVLMGNSIGSLVCCTAARDRPAAARGLVLCNCAAGMNNKFIVTDKRTPAVGKLIFGAIFGLLDILLSIDAFANWFFAKIKSVETVSNVLKGVYVDKTAVDDELVRSILDPAEDPNALNAFVKILTGDPGTTPDKFMDQIKQPILLVWGNEDPFTPIDAGYGIYFTKELLATRDKTELVVVNGGHCPQDDGPAAIDVNKGVRDWLSRLAPAPPGALL